MITFRNRLTIVAFVSFAASMLVSGTAAEIFIRASQASYQAKDSKLAIAFSQEPLPSTFDLIGLGVPPLGGSGSRVNTSPERTADEHVIFRGKSKPVTNAIWGQFRHHAELDLSSVRRPGTYRVKVGDSQSLPLRIGADVYGEFSVDLLEFMRQQRCGFNPWLGTNCHQLDGRTDKFHYRFGELLDTLAGKGYEFVRVDELLQARVEKSK